MIQVRVPGTTANLGPGFDCMGLALDVWNSFELRLDGAPGTCQVQVTGEGEDRLPADEDNLVVKIIRERLGSNIERLDKGLSIRCHAGVPCGSGMGSSSTAVVAGTIFTQALRLYLQGNQDIEPEMISQDEVLREAVEIEGHGDNVGPALLGGLLLIMPDEHGGVIVRNVPFKPIKVVICVPSFDYLTVDARNRLPKQVPFKDAVFNLGRAMFVLHALEHGDDDLLSLACEDRLHEPYRFPDIPGAANVRQAALGMGAIAVALSGAGPGVLAFARENHAAIGRAMQTAYEEAGLKARWWAIDATTTGAQIARLP